MSKNKIPTCITKEAKLQNEQQTFISNKGNMFNGSIYDVSIWTSVTDMTYVGSDTQIFLKSTNMIRRRNVD